MINEVTAKAIVQLNSLAEAVGISDPYFKIEASTRGTWFFLWTITTVSTVDLDNFYLKEISGIKFLVEKPSAIFLTNVSIDYSETLAVNGYPNQPSHSQMVWPRGFVFNDLLYLGN